MNVLIEMTRLVVNRPEPDASDDEVAAWYLAKGRLHLELAAQELRRGRCADVELRHAISGYTHARALARRTDTDEQFRDRDPKYSALRLDHRITG